MEMKVLIVVLSLCALAYGQDPVCLAGRLQSIQNCVTELATNPTTFCTSQCGTDLGAAYTDCGYTGTSNPVEVVCGSGTPNEPGTSNPNVPATSDPNVPDAECLSDALLSPGDVRNCNTEFSTSTGTSFCSTGCAATLRNAYTGCGYTSNTNNVVNALCGSGTGGAPAFTAIPLMIVSGIIVALASFF